MPSESTISVHREIQQAAKAVLHELAAQISATDTECSIVEKAYSGLCRPGLSGAPSSGNIICGNTCDGPGTAPLLLQAEAEVADNRGFEIKRS